MKMLPKWLDNRLTRLIAKLVIGVFIAVFALYYWLFAPFPVTSYRVETGNIIAEVLGTGTLEARVKASISPKITGLLTQVLVDQGDRVKKDQPLATLDDRDLLAQVEVYKAEIAAAKAALERSAADITRAEALVRQAKLDYDRISQLWSSQAATRQEFDRVTEQYNVALADLKRAQAAKLEAERQVVRAEETLHYHQEQLADTKIQAPFDGLILRRAREPGDVVVPGGTILDLISTEQLWISAWVDEAAMAPLVPQQPARVVFRSEPHKGYPGTVARVSPQTDRETREFLVDVNVTELPQVWSIGQRAEVYIQTAKREGVVVVPQRMIVWHEEQAGVFVSDNGRARWRKVTLGLRGRDLVEITEGLAVGQIVVVPRGAKSGNLRDGQIIQPP
jgi:HlyD family secretion protein